MNDICEAILRIVFAILFALLAGQVETDMFLVFWLALGSVCNVWRAIELFMGEDMF